MGAYLISEKDEDVLTRINHLQRMILVHSYLYYELNDNIIDDHRYDKISKELAELQTYFPDIAKTSEGWERFKDWTGASGAFLTYEWNEKNRAEHLLRYHKRLIKERKSNE